ncbi:MAG: sulfurtransferase TusA family protein [Leptospirillia bacterium]
MSDIASDTAVDQILDICGVTCPITFVKSKLTLERMQPGQVLKVLIDYPPSAENVPRSLAHEGHEIISITETDGPLWTLLVRKA